MNLEEGIQMTAFFREENNNVLDPVYQGKGILPICESFDREFLIPYWVIRIVQASVSIRVWMLIKINDLS